MILQYDTSLPYQLQGCHVADGVTIRATVDFEVNVEVC